MRATKLGTLVAGLLLATASLLDGQEPESKVWYGWTPVTVQRTMQAARASLGLVRANMLQARATLPMAQAGVEMARQALAAASASQDPADSLYRAAREAMNRGDYRAAARMFERLRRSYAESGHLADSYYWQAFALYRTSEQDELRRALELIAVQEAEHAEAATRRDARSLEARIEGQLARRGDARAAARVAERASRTGPVANQQACEQDEVRVAALNALMQMDPEQAVPVLKRVMERRDECAAPMRRQVIFVLSQQGGADVEEVMIAAVMNDPDQEVRESAVFWLSQVGTERAVDALEMILFEHDDTGLQENALFALSQHGSERASEILRRYAQDGTKPTELRANAIFSLSQNGSAGSAEFLIDLYEGLEDSELKEGVFFSLAQLGDETTTEWMLERAMDPNESMELRKQALFWAAQSGAGFEKLEGLYEADTDREMREQLIFAYGQRHDRASIDRLIEIARSEEDTELRTAAIFWLGQSGDERAARFLLELIEKP